VSTHHHDELARLGGALKELLLASYVLAPDGLAGAVAGAAAIVGAQEAVVLVADLDEEVLRPLDPSLGGDDHRIDDPGAGVAYREDRTVIDGGADGRRRLWVPLKDSAERIGVLELVDEGDVDVSTWEALASLAGEMVVSKGSYGDTLILRRRLRQVSLAAEMRWSLLPSLTYTGPDVSITGLVRPSYGIAGDAFDYGVTGRVASVAILDAMGHGLEASRMANVAISSYRNCRRSGLAPAETLVVMDEVMAEQFGDARFATAQVANLDIDGGELTVANAGHPPPVVVRDGSFRQVGCPPARPVGLGVGRPIPVSVVLEPGDVVLFQTDGAVDARSPAGEPFGEERLVDLVTKLVAAGLPVAEVLRQTGAEVIAHQGGRAGDDITLLLLRWHP
jgi:hypothetical protein